MAIAAIVKADVFSFAAELNNKFDDQFWADVLAYVNQYDLTSTDTDEDRRLARIFLAAHIGANELRAKSGAAGPLTSESAGGVRRSYGLVASSTSASLNSTRYGTMFLFILESSGCAGPFVI